MKIFKVFLVLLCSTLYTLSHVPPALAEGNWIPPQPPFSVEGNPPRDYFFGPIFELNKFIRPQNLQIYENRDRSRQYENLWVCGKERDYRDYDCTYQDRSCDGGDVELCVFGSGEFARMGHSGPNDSCTAKPPSEKYPEGQEGTCNYRKLPKIAQEYAGTDFSVAPDLVFNKLQSEAGAYVHTGHDDNPITYGSQHLSLNFDEKIIRQLLVVKRAKQTKATLHETGQWPLGWVDWGYTTPNGKTLLEIYDELPDEIVSPLINIVEGVDDFFLNAGDLESVSDTYADQEQVSKVVHKALSQNPTPTWLIDLMQAPLYSPSWRLGYVRPSICVWKICCPGFMCKVPPPEGTKRGLYYDSGISQEFGAALDDMLLHYNLESGVKEFKKLVFKNPLVRFATSASVNATTAKINERLTAEISSQDQCYKYRAGMGSWLAFGTHMDYVQQGDFLDKEEKCPDYWIMPELDKQNAGAFTTRGVFAWVAMKWGQQQDDVDPVKYHILTIPDIMGQAIADIKQPVYNTRDTLAELESIKDFNYSLSNTVDDQQDYLYGGKFPYVSRRYLGLYPCADDMFSSQLDTSIKEYAEGKRVGCFQTTSTESAGKCDGTKFAAIIADSPWKEPSSAATQVVLNSAMFVGGKLNPKLEEVYAAVEKETGVPCEVLAGHHFEEASSHFTDSDDPEKYSAANGGPVGEQGGFKATVESAARSVRSYAVGNFENTAKLMGTMSNFNGGGNANCQAGFTGGTIPYAGCPRQFYGEDDPYVTNMLDAKHMNMYLLYCGDFLPCTPPKPYGTDRPGAFAVALAVYNNATSKNAPSTSGSPAPSTSSISNYGKAPSTGSSINPAGTCGDGYIDTALGCLAYERKEFIMALLRFLSGISGAIALVSMLIATVQIMTAGGDAKKLQAARELFFSAITGLLFLIFAVSLLRIFGADILKLPGFGR